MTYKVLTPAQVREAGRKNPEHTLDGSDIPENSLTHSLLGLLASVKRNDMPEETAFQAGLNYYTNGEGWKLVSVTAEQVILEKD